MVMEKMEINDNWKWSSLNLFIIFVEIYEDKQVSVLEPKLMAEFDPWNIHGVRRRITPTNCTFNSTWGHVYAPTYTYK